MVHLQNHRVLLGRGWLIERHVHYSRRRKTFIYPWIKRVELQLQPTPESQPKPQPASEPEPEPEAKLLPESLLVTESEPETLSKPDSALELEIEASSGLPPALESIRIPLYMCTLIHSWAANQTAQSFTSAV